jgi:hydroxymethylbilane synthase
MTRTAAHPAHPAKAAHPAGAGPRPAPTPRRAVPARRTAERGTGETGGTGFFVSAPRDALLAGEIDSAVQSLKDLPTTDSLLPAPDQGASAVECRSAAASTAEADSTSVLAELDDPLTRAAVTAERAMPAALEADCSAPVGASADPAAAAVGEPVTELRPRGVVGTTDGVTRTQMSTTGPAPTSCGDAETPLRPGRELAAEMLAKGAAGPMGERAL